MKDFYIGRAGSAMGQVITSVFLVLSKETRLRRTGAAYVAMLLADRTGVIEAKLWDHPELADRISPDHYAKIEGRITSYRNRAEITISRLREAGDEEVDPADFMATTAYSVEALWAELAGFIESMEDSGMRQLLRAFFEDEAIAPGLRRVPAAKMYHHAFLGGLLEHTVSLCRLSVLAHQNYPWLNRDLLIAGAFLHDIGKIHELTSDRSISYTVEGKLLGHVALGISMLQAKAVELPNIPRPLITILEHLILSHHGEFEYGAPVEPATPEAVLLHHLDSIDSKLAAIRVALESEPESPNWSARVPSLRRNILRTQHFLTNGG